MEYNWLGSTVLQLKRCCQNSSSVHELELSWWSDRSKDTFWRRREFYWTWRVSQRAEGHVFQGGMGPLGHPVRLTGRTRVALMVQMVNSRFKWSVIYFHFQITSLLTPHFLIPYYPYERAVWLLSGLFTACGARIFKLWMEELFL